MAASGSEWLAGYLTAGKDLTTARAKSDVIREAHETASEWPEYRERYKMDFEAVIAEVTGYDPETLDNERHRTRPRRKSQTYTSGPSGRSPTWRRKHRRTWPRVKSIRSSS
jgi:hypothetical protein